MLQLMLANESGQLHVARYLDKLQRHIITAVCEAEDACTRQSRNSEFKQGRDGRRRAEGVTLKIGVNGLSLEKDGDKTVIVLLY